MSVDLGDVKRGKASSELGRYIILTITPLFTFLVCILFFKIGIVIRMDCYM